MMNNNEQTISAVKAAERLIERLKDERVDRHTAIEATIQQLRLLIEPVKAEPKLAS